MGVFQAALPAVCVAALVANSASARSLTATPPPVTPSPGDSVARCKIDLSSSGFVQNAKAIAVTAAAEVSLAICDTGSAQFGITETAVAKATAEYAANAIATASIDCYSQGQSQFKVNGKSIATATAQAWASAFAEATATASVCNKCSSKASVFASVVEDVIITATAKAEFDISSAKGGPVQVVQIIDRVIKEGTIVAIATAVADARASVLKGCETEVLIEGAAGDSKNPSTFFCNVQSNALDLSIKKDAIIKASNTAAASAGCYENDSVTSILAAEELAIAAATVLSEVVIACDVVGKGGACALGAADINTTVTATARVFAQAFANATSTCKKSLCKVEVDVIAEAVASVLSSAASAAKANVCFDNTGSVDIEVFELVSNVSTIKALASIITSASVVDGVCNIKIDEIVASTTTDNKVTVTEGVTVIINGVPQVFPATPVKAPATPVKVPAPVKTPVKVPAPVKTPVKVTPPVCVGACVADGKQCASSKMPVAPCCGANSKCISIGGGAGVCGHLVNTKNVAILPCTH